MEDDRKMICDRCRKAVLIADVRYLALGNNKTALLCSSCRAGKPVKESKKPLATKQVKKSYVCSRCKYKFKYTNDGTTNLKCPFCGLSDKVREDKLISANDIIKASIKDD